MYMSIHSQHREGHSPRIARYTADSYDRAWAAVSNYVKHQQFNANTNVTQPAEWLHVHFIDLVTSWPCYMLESTRQDLQHILTALKFDRFLRVNSSRHKTTQPPQLRVTVLLDLFITIQRMIINRQFTFHARVSVITIRSKYLQGKSRFNQGWKKYDFFENIQQ